MPTSLSLSSYRLDPPLHQANSPVRGKRLFRHGCNLQKETKSDIVRYIFTHLVVPVLSITIMLTRQGRLELLFSRRGQAPVFSKEIFDTLWPYLDRGSKRAVRQGCSQMCAMASALVTRLDLSAMQGQEHSMVRDLRRVGSRLSGINTLVLFANSSKTVHSVLAVTSEQHFPNLTSLEFHLVGLHCTPTAFIPESMAL
jgi:hypothetical protein